MKIFQRLILISSLLTITITAQENYSVYFVDELNGWMCGDLGIIKKTTDGGITWTEQSLGEGQRASSICFIDLNNGWAARGRTFYKTTNGGESWSHQTVGGSGELLSIYFINSTLGFACGNIGLYETTDGGNNWSLRTLPGYQYNDVYFLNENLGWLTASDYLGRTTNGGTSWSFIYVPPAFRWQTFFVNSLVGWNVAEYGFIYKSTDGGVTWIQQTSPTTWPLTSVHFYDSNNGMAVAWNGTILTTTNGGSHWNTIGGCTSVVLWSVKMLTQNTAIIVGADGIILKVENGICGVVPVELTSFIASINNDQVLLKWETATEVNNYGFNIERSVNDDGWEKMGFVEGHGNSNSPKQYSFTDKNPVGGSVFLYRLKQIDIDGKYEYSDEIEVEIIPDEFALYQNFPNPFNPNTKIGYQLPQETIVIIKIYDILGAEVITLLNEQKEPGIYEVDFNAQHLPSGTYIYRIVADNFVKTKKMVMMK